jgi:DNA-binding PadR family transcriptional regulator
MKGSEAILRAVANEGGKIAAVQVDTWVGLLVKAGFLDIEAQEEGDVFYYQLTPKAKQLLRSKGVKV